MPDHRKKLGDFGEQAAAAYLTRQGMRVLARKWRCAEGEIDLVLRDGETFVFVEVRTRRAGSPGSAEESVGRAKQARLVALAYTYCATHALPEQALWRIDVVAIELDRAGRVARLNHIPHAITEF